jgi:hypothetical protein
MRIGLILSEDDILKKLKQDSPPCMQIKKLPCPQLFINLPEKQCHR